jgi:general secretion pathway protein D
MHVGDRYPIIVNGYVGNTSGGTVYTPPPTVQFQDLGLVLKITPSVHQGGDVTLEVEAEYNVLGAETANNIPIISRRKYTGKVRLAGNETAVLAGMFKTSRSETRSGLFGLHRLPLIGRFFRSNALDTEDSEILLTMRPRLLSLPPFETPVPTLWVGTESRPLTQF